MTSHVVLLGLGKGWSDLPQTCKVRGQAYNLEWVRFRARLWSCWHSSGETFTTFTFGQICVKHAGNQDRHKISEEFEFRQDRAIHFDRSYLSFVCRKKNNIYLTWGKWCQHNGTFSFDRIFLKLADTEDRHYLIKSQTRLIVGQIRQFALELLARAAKYCM